MAKCVSAHGPQQTAMLSGICPRYYLTRSQTYSKPDKATHNRRSKQCSKKLTMQRNMAYRRRQPKATHDRRLLCSQSDSEGHLLGGCLHKEMTALYIARHIKATMRFVKPVLNKKHVVHYVVADVGTLEGLQQLRVQNKSPAFILGFIMTDCLYKIHVTPLKKNKQERIKGTNSD